MNSPESAWLARVERQVAYLLVALQRERMVEALARGGLP